MPARGHPNIERLLVSLNALVDASPELGRRACPEPGRRASHTIILIEHHRDVILTADHVVDLGPDGGHAGVRVVATGTPEAIAACAASHTGIFLRIYERGR